MTDFCHLHVHSEYSPLDGLSKPEEIIDRALEHGQRAIALTDHGQMGGYIRFKEAAEGKPVRPIYGVEAYFVDDVNKDTKDNKKERYHLTLLAMNEQGLKNLFKIHTIAWNKNFYMKPRVDFTLLEGLNDGIIALSGCLGGAISQAIIDGEDQRVDDLVTRFKSIFSDRFYLEVQPWTDSEQKKVNARIKEISSVYNIPIVGTIDCHYPDSKDRGFEDVFLAIGQSSSFTGNQQAEAREKSIAANNIPDLCDRMDHLWPDRRLTFKDIQVYIMDNQETEKAFWAAGFDESPLEVACDIADRCVAEYKFQSDLLPSYVKHEKISMGSKEYLAEIAWQRMKDMGFDGDKEYEDRLKMELEIILSKGFADYFLILHDICAHARRMKIGMGPARGSSGSSLLSYLLMITSIDPIKHDLLFFRFLTPERNDMPDIDLDFEDRRREEIKQYIRDKWGEDYVASVSAYGQLHGKSTIKDISRVLGVPYKETNSVTSKFNDLDQFEKKWELSEFRSKYPDMIKIARRLDGLIRNPSLHAAGMVVSSVPLHEIVPVESRADKANDRRVPALAFDKDEVEKAGLIKMDILGVKMVSVIEDALNKIKAEKGEDVRKDSLDIDTPDERIYKEISAGKTAGIFQIEGGAFTNITRNMEFRTFDDIVVANALIRPGSFNTQGAKYLACRDGKQQAKYPHPLVEPYLNKTYGTWIFEEQLMQSLVYLAGFSWGQADKFRKIISKKLSVREFAPYKKEFIDGVTKHITQDEADAMWEDILKASSYMFNKAHSVAYALLAYQTAWLKINYPTEYIWALLKNEDDLSKITTYLFEARRLGVEVLPPSVNESDLSFSLNGGDIQFGLSNVSGVGPSACKEILNLRPFNSFEDFTNRCSKVRVKAHMIENLEKVGAFECINHESGYEYSKYYASLLNYPVFFDNTDFKEILDNIGDFDADEPGMHLIRGIVLDAKKTDRYNRITIEDETGKCSVFASMDIDIEKRQSIYALVGDVALHHFIDAADVKEAWWLKDYEKIKNETMWHNYGDLAAQFDVWNKLVGVGRHKEKTLGYLISSSSFVTKKGQTMGAAYIWTEEGGFEQIVCFSTQYAQKKHLLKETGKWYLFQTNITRDGSFALSNMIAADEYIAMHS